METDRRTVLRVSGMAAVLGATGLAGCGGLLGGGGSGSAGDWIYDPTVVASAPTTVFGSMAYGRLYEMRDELPESANTTFAANPDSPVQPADIDDVALVGGGQVSADGTSGAAFGSGAVTGEIPRSDLVSEIESGDSVEPAGSYEGYSLYEVTNLQESMVGVPGTSQVDGSGTVAVGDSAALAGFSFAQGVETSASGEAAVRTMIDAASGGARRLSETSGPASEVQSRVGDDMIAVGASVSADLVEAGEQFGPGGRLQSQLLTGLRGGGAGIDLDGQTATVTGVLVYETEQQAADSRIVNIVNGASGNLEDREGIDSVEASQDGAIIVVTLTGNLETLAQTGMQGGGGFAMPATR